MAVWKQIRVLHFRNMCIRKHHWLAALLEILIPAAIFGLIAYTAAQYNRPHQEQKVEYGGTSKIIYPPEDLGAAISKLYPYYPLDLTYAPKNNLTDKIVNEMISVIRSKRAVEVTPNGVANASAIVERLTTEYQKKYPFLDAYPFGVYFSNIDPSSDKLPDKVECVIWPVSSDIDTSSLIDSSESRTMFAYWSSGFMVVEWAVNLAVQNLRLPNTFGLPKIYIEKFPSPDSPSANLFLKIGAYIYVGITIFSMILVFLFLQKNIISEKETGAKELQKMMGLKSWMTWVGWLMAVFMTQIIVVTIIVVFLTIPVFGEPLLKTSSSLLWAFLMLYVLVAACFCFALCPIFKRPTVGACITIGLWIATVWDFNIRPDSPFKILDHLLFLFPNVALTRGWHMIFYFEAYGDGANWSNFLTAPMGESFPFATVFLNFVLQCIVFSIITWYLDAIWPGPYGIPESPIFFFKKSYWVGTKISKDFLDDQNYGNNRNFERVSEDLKPGIQVRNLKKSFKNFTAVNKISINFYEGEITALLGHNGAGKTTTMSMLTGMIPADSGKVIIDDYNIFDNISHFRTNLGLCPQHSLLFDHLNTVEHLIFFGLLKGLSKTQAHAEALHLMELQNISSKRTAMAHQLSGGMKRKLSLAIALIGSPKILILDEPTSGMDPESRREMWNLLLSMRGERTIILTTHFMEEADVLGDRIAIMDHGEIKCYGTSIMLKKLYGAGYYLNILKKKNFTPSRALITSAIQAFVPEAELKSDSGPTLSYILPTETVDAFPAMFSKLESLRDELGISSLGIACTTMEEVFLKVGEVTAAEEKETVSLGNVRNRNGNSGATHNINADPQTNLLEFDSIDGDSIKCKPNQVQLAIQRFVALLKKKIKYSFRRWMMYFIFGILPILASIFANFLMNDQETTLPALNLNTNTYKWMQVFYQGDDSSPYVSNLKELIHPQSPTKIQQSEDVNKYLLSLGSQDRNEYYSENLIALTVNSTAIVALYNPNAIHSMPIAVNLAYNLILKTKADTTVSTMVHPLRLHGKKPCENDLVAVVAYNGVSVIVCFGILLMFLTGSFIAFPILERLNNAKQLQLMTGVSPALYWFTTLITDYFYFIVVSFLCVLAFFVGGNLETDAALVLCAILIISGVSLIRFAYIVSYFKKSHAASFSVYLVINLFIGLFGALYMYSKRLYHITQKEDVPFGLNFADFVLRLLPQYSFNISLLRFLAIASLNKMCKKCPKLGCESTYSYFEFDGQSFQNFKVIDGLNSYLMSLVIIELIYLTITLLAEWGYLEHLSRFVFISMHGEQFYNENQAIEDPDVQEEKYKVDSAKSRLGNESDHLLIVDNLVKKFSRQYAAVRGVSFTVKPGECFGLLGVNGAGKTTTFRMISGDTLPTTGDCSISKYLLSKNRQKYLSMIGYCPQFDGINEFLTGHEMLETFAMLRGIPRWKINREISKWVSTLGLQEYEHKSCGTYSGGNKRKLSTAMALIGDPSLVILDEPTSGVDPISRRKLWNVLMESRASGQGIVLTSHSMDECETLCDRLTIMVAGRMKCIGNVEYLKQRYAQGYTIMIKLKNAQESDLQELKQMVSEIFRTGIVLKDEHAGMLNYHITEPTVLLSELFSKLQNIRNNMNVVEDYQICNTTLEQVFLAFARSEAQIIET